MPQTEDVHKLLEQSREIEDHAAQIQQGESVGASDSEINQIVEAYQRWFASCVATLPKDLEDRFRAEYAGPWYAGSRIKAFLEAPTKQSDIHKLAAPEHRAMWSFWLHPFETSFRAHLLAQRQILIEAGARQPESTNTTMAVTQVERLGRRLSVFLRQLKTRQRGRVSRFAIEDEYDLQDVLHAMLRLHFDDVRPEEYTPSYAGGSSRIDFVLKAERVVVEAKMMRQSLSVRELGEQLIIDIDKYRVHPDCGALVAIVYDPEFEIGNPKELESDLSRVSDGLRVVVIVSQG
jgi:REase_DpnII-MboI